MKFKEFTEKKIEEKNCVLVGIRIDSYSRLLLNWAIVKVAEPGDRVVAVHVCRGSDPALKEKNESLKCYLEVYEGLCSVKQVDLIGQISHGNSVRKLLAREAKNCSAMTVVVGGCASMARYCAKRLPPTTAVLAVHNGKVVFERASSLHKPVLGGNQSYILHPIRTSTSQMVQNSKGGSKDSGDSKDDYFSVHEYKEEDSMDYISLLIRDLPESKPGWPLLRRACTLNPEVSVHEYKEKDSMDYISLLIRDLPESKLGWPLLRRACTLNPEALRGYDARKMPVVQWVMSLPNRSPPLSPKTPNDSGSDATEDVFGKVLMSNKNCLSAWGDLPKEVELLLKTNSSGCKWFSHMELKNSTSQFAPENLIGKGGCSRVYKGCLPDGKSVAVKIMKSSKEEWKEFALEVDIISSLKHKHITPLIGVCIEENNLITVYEFLSKGSLEKNLHDKKDKYVLSWEVRFNVAVEIAEALNYLHGECSRPVIHRDVKSSNILLNDEFQPQLSDFGLAIWGPRNSSFMTHGDVVGTFGYLAPEYFMYGKVSDKIDVYSFGVVLLELLSGRRPIGCKTSKGHESLVMWAKPILERGDLRGVLDPDLNENLDEDQMRRMVLAATLCITQTARLRPKISQILKLLRGENEIEDWVNSHSGDDPKESDNQEEDDEVYPDSSVASHLGLALLDVDDDTTSFSSVDQNNPLSLEDYLKGRWSRSSSFD